MPVPTSANKEKQIRNTLWYFTPLTAGLIAQLVALKVFTLVLPPSDFGIAALAIVYAAFASGIANFGMVTAFDRNFFQCRNDNIPPALLLYSCLAFVFLNFTWLIGLTYLFKGHIARFLTGSAESGAIVFTALCAQMFTSLLVYYLNYFRNSNEADLFAKYTIANSVLNLGLAIVLVVYVKIGVIGIFYAQLFSGALVFLLLSYRFLSTSRFAVNAALLRSSLQIAWPLTPRIFFGVIGTQMDKYMLGLLATLGNVGIYDIGQRISKAVFTFLTAIQNTYSPQVYRQMFENPDDGGIKIGRYLTPFAYLSLAVALLAAVLAEEIVIVLTPSAFHGATSIISVLSVYYGILFFGKVNGNQLIYMKKTHMTSILTALSIIINIALNIPFIYLWGAIGAAWATSLSGIISGFISFITAQHYYRINWEYSKIVGMLSILLGTAFTLAALYEMESAYAYRLLVKALALVAYGILGLHLKVVSRENLLALFYSLRGKDVIDHPSA